MTTSAVVLADSIPAFTGTNRLTTLEVTFPRYILAEMNTHRVFSRNSASSRAIPVERQIRKVLDDPFVPARFPVNQKGMSASEFFLPGTSAYDETRYVWLLARDLAVDRARELLKLGVHKQVANRLLEPFMQHTAIISSTEWENFFKLRLELRDDGEPVADPEMYRAALVMHTALYDSAPRMLDWDEWHLPLVTADEVASLPAWTCAKVSASRCARSSYERQHDDELGEVTLARANSLAASGHLSPWEHPAHPSGAPVEWANFVGWCQGRWYLEKDLSP